MDNDVNLPTATTLSEQEICDVAFATFSKDEQVQDRKEEEHDSDIDYEVPPTTRDLTTALIQGSEEGRKDFNNIINKSNLRVKS